MPSALSSSSSPSTPAPGLAGPARGALLYREVKKQLIADIRSGRTPPGAALPNEKELAERFQVSIGTLRRAVEELVADHILVRQQGRGTFVGKLDEARFMYQFFKIEPREGAREFPVLQLHAFARARATPQEADALALPNAASVLRIDNVLSLRGRPVIHDRITLAATHVSRPHARAVRAAPGHHLRAVPGRVRHHRDRRRRARAGRARDAGQRRACWASLAGTPVLRIERVAFTFDQKPAELRISVVNTEDVDYVSRMRQQV